MTSPLFVWLGSGRARKRGVADSSVQSLDRATQAGLPVPPAAVLLDEFYRFALDNGLARADGDRIFIPDAELWHNTLHYSVRLPRFARPVLVRPACAPSDRSTPPTPNVNFSDAESAARAVALAWSARPTADPLRRDVLIMEIVPADVHGTATMTEAEGADRINLSGGERGGTTLELPRLRGWARPDAGPSFARRLQQLLRGVRRTLGRGDWRLNWADDGQICWLLTVEELGEPEPLA